MKRLLMLIFGLVLVGYMAVVALVGINQRKLLFFPSHDADPNSPLSPWIVEGQIIGYCHEVAHPRAVWLMAHGNAGQASQRGYVLGLFAYGIVDVPAVSHMSAFDSLYVVEYPGYGLRDGSPSKGAMNAAVVEAYRALRQRYTCPIGVLAESIGSGPASVLASLAGLRPPDAFVFVVPFDTLASVAADHMPFLPVGLLLRDDWDNIAALKGCSVPITIYGAEEDLVIPVRHARRLAEALPQARFVLIHGGHNDWSASGDVRIEMSKDNPQGGKP